MVRPSAARLMPRRPRAFRHGACDATGVLKFARIHCGACHSVKRVRFSPLVAGLHELGATASCASCRHIAFTLVRGRDVFCPICDTLQPLDMVPSSVPGAGFACCGACGQLLAALYADVAAASGL